MANIQIGALEAQCVSGVKNVGDSVRIRATISNTGGTAITVYVTTAIAQVGSSCPFDAATINPRSSMNFNCDVDSIPTEWADMSLGVIVTVWADANRTQILAQESCPDLLTVNPIGAVIVVDRIEAI